MKRYAQFDADGFPLGFWSDDIYPSAPDEERNAAIPADAIQITTQQWRALIDNAGLRRWMDGHVVPYELPSPSVDQLWADVRAERDRRLSASDWTQVSDAPVDQVAWATYRQALRDLPETTTDPGNVLWPVPPSSGGVT